MTQYSSNNSRISKYIIVAICFRHHYESRSVRFRISMNISSFPLVAVMEAFIIITRPCAPAHAQRNVIELIFVIEDCLLDDRISLQPCSKEQ